MNKRLYNQTVTVYTPYRKPSPNTDCTMIRAVVHNCHWEENSILVFRATGVTQTANVEITFPRGRDGDIPIQIIPEEWGKLPPDADILQQYYAFALTGATDTFWTQPRVFRGDLELTFAWGTSAAITTAINNAAIQHGLKTIRDVNYNWFGSRKLNHVIVRT